MKITAIKTKTVKRDDDLKKILKESINDIPEKSILVITSKIISLCGGDYVQLDENTNKTEIIRKEADFWTSADLEKYTIDLTIKNNTIIPNSGVDESNANETLILWPKNIQQRTNDLWEWLRKVYQVKELGLLFSDSTVPTLRRGTIGFALSHCGFRSIKNYVGKKDLFDREMHMSFLNIRDNLASSGVLVMGEGAESTPMAIAEDIPHVEFQSRPPTKEELDFLLVEKENDLYKKFYNKVDWKTKP